VRFEGNVWKVGDRVSATDLVPSRYDEQGMSKRWDECAEHFLEDLQPTVATKIEPGDLLVGGHGFGAGHAHYYLTAIMGAATAGIRAVLAESVGALYLRASIDAGQPIWAVPGITSLVEQGHRLRVDLRNGTAWNLTTATEMSFAPVSPIVVDILQAGGSSAWAHARVHGTRV
jgi:3-isopropylmalate/(R)-2-methylmalate dehydratase small subunit